MAFFPSASASAGSSGLVWIESTTRLDTCCFYYITLHRRHHCATPPVRTMTRAQVFGTHRLVAISSFVLLETRNRTDRTNRTEPNRSFIRTCQQTDNKAHGFLFSVYAATSGAVGFGAWFAALRFAPIPSEIRPIVVAVRLSTREE